MKNKKNMIGLTMLLSATVLLSGCGSSKALEREQAYRQIGINALAQGNYADAIDNFQKALDQSPGKVRNLEIDICLQKAEAYFLNGQIEEALEVCNAIIDYKKDEPKAYYIRGNLYLQQQETELARKDYQKAESLADGDYEIYIALYENLSRCGMTEDAAAYLDKALKLKGDSRYDLTNKGYINYLKGDYTQAKSLLTAALEKKETDADDKTALYLAQTMDALGDSDGAAQYYSAYAEKHADDPKVLEQLGNLAMQKEDYPSALAYYQKGLDVGKAANEQLLRRGEIAALEYMLQFDAAREKMAQYVLDYPDDEQAARENLFLKTRNAVALQLEKEAKEAQKATAAEAVSEAAIDAQESQEGQSAQ